MLPPSADIERARASIADTSEPPTVGVVLGSGLGGFARHIQNKKELPYAQIAGMPAPGVAGHAGCLHLGEIEGVRVACLQGRAHGYEGHAPERVCFGVTLLAAMGCRAVLLTNAAGGIAPSLLPGDFMLIGDHLNLTGLNPLLGPKDERAPRFPDMSRAYDEGLRALAYQAARAAGIELKEGVYAGMLGPSYETPAEIRMLRTLGASAVGMSTVWEVIALRALGVDVGAVSCITNKAAGETSAPITHEEVQETAHLVEARFETLMRNWIALSGASD